MLEKKATLSRVFWTLKSNRKWIASQHVENGLQINIKRLAGGGKTKWIISVFTCPALYIMIIHSITWKYHNYENTLFTVQLKLYLYQVSTDTNTANSDGTKWVGWRPLEPDFYHCFSVKRTTNRDFRSKITRLISHQYSIMFGQSLIFKMHTQARKKCILFRKKGNENFLEGNINYRWVKRRDESNWGHTHKPILKKTKSQKRFLEYEDFKATYRSFKQSFEPGKFNCSLPTVFTNDIDDVACG